MDVLIFIERPEAEPSQSRQTVAHAIQSAGDRLHVLTEAEAKTLPNARLLVKRQDLEAARVAMSDQEWLFAEAWFARKTDKDRTGASLPWDTPGYEAP